MTNILVSTFAITLCLANAVTWTFVTGLPWMGAAWVVAAVACVMLQKWAWYPWGRGVRGRTPINQRSESTATV